MANANLFKRITESTDTVEAAEALHECMAANARVYSPREAQYAIDDLATQVERMMDRPGGYNEKVGKMMADLVASLRGCAKDAKKAADEDDKRFAR